MAVPMRYREIGDFQEYYSGRRKAPYLTLFIGGNHEASNHLWELYYGGWVAPNIYYMGAANVIRIGSLRIAGLSGIWKGYNYKKPHFERLPLNSDDVRSFYHVRELDTRKLLQLRTQVDVGLSHDWPRGIEWLGDWKWLFKKKDQFEAEAREGSLGSVAAKLVLDRLRPPHWFSAHLHIKYAAILDHSKVDQIQSGSQIPGKPIPAEIRNGDKVVQNTDEIALDVDEEGSSLNGSAKPATPLRNDDEIDLDDDDDDATPELTSAEGANPIQESNLQKRKLSDVRDEVRAQLPAAFTKPTAPPPQESAPEPTTTIINNITRFLALDKCLPRRDFLQLLEIQPLEAPETPLQRPLRLLYDPEWLAVTRAFAKGEPLQLSDPSATLPRDKGHAYYAPLINVEREWVEVNIVQKDKMAIPEDFQITAPVYDPSQPLTTNEMPMEYTNPHTTAFCELLEIPNPFDADEEERELRRKNGPRAVEDRGGGRGRGRGGRGFHGGDHRGGRGGHARGRGGGRGGGPRGRGRPWR